MRIFSGVEICGSGGSGPCFHLNSAAHSPAPAGRESGPEYLRALEAAVPDAGDGEIGAALNRLWRDMLGEVRMRCEKGEFSSVESGIAAVGDELEALLSASEDEYLRARAADVRAIRRKMLALPGAAAPEPTLPEGCIPVAEEPDVFQALAAQRAHAPAVVVRRLSPLSHAAILLRGSGIAIARASFDLKLLAEGEMLRVDGASGTVILQPDAAALTGSGQAARALPPPGLLHMLPGGETFRLSISCCGSWESVPGEYEIGLLRTEFFCQRLGRIPAEAELTAEYAAVLRAHPSVVLRLMDAGGDKRVPGLETENSALRGTALLLERPAMLKTQLRAILRAAVFGHARILLPMVLVPEEIESVRRCIALCAAELAEENIRCGRIEGVGAMLESLSAVCRSEAFAEASDFASIGTNDLLADALSLPRSKCFALPAPDRALLARIQSCVSAFNRAGKPVSVCGEAAADETWLKALIAAGLRRASVAPEALTRISAFLDSMPDAP